MANATVARIPQLGKGRLESQQRESQAMVGLYSLHFTQNIYSLFAKTQPSFLGDDAVLGYELLGLAALFFFAFRNWHPPCFLLKTNPIEAKRLGKNMTSQCLSNILALNSPVLFRKKTIN